VGNTGAIKSTTRTQYSVETYWWYDPGYYQDSYWRLDGSGPGGNTYKLACTRVKEDIERMKKNGNFDPAKIKICIKKIVTVEAIEEELTGSDFTALMLKID
jgi:hypothetical protein